MDVLILYKYSTYNSTFTVLYLYFSLTVHIVQYHVHSLFQKYYVQYVYFSKYVTENVSLHMYSTTSLIYNKFQITQHALHSHLNI
jgi:hypothetical protein